MWTSKQKSWLQNVKSCAFIDDKTYRDALLKYTSCAHSSTDERLTNDHFEVVMKWLEKQVGIAIADELISPEKVISKIGDPWFFTRKALEKNGDQKSNTFRSRRGDTFSNPATPRQICMIKGIQNDLSHFEPEVIEFEYLKSMLYKTGEKNVGETFPDLNTRQAGHLIDALRDRLTYARQRAEQQAENDVVPF